MALPDPVGEVIDGFRLANGLDVRKVRVPLGVIAVVYEARPNVTIDAAALCLKSGQRDRAARLLDGRAFQRGAGCRGDRSRSLRRDAGRGDGARRRRPRGSGAARHAGGSRRPDHPARRRGPEGGAEGRGDGAGHVRGVGQLPRVRGRDRVARGCAGDHFERKGPAPERVQRGRDAARARGGRCRFPADGAAARCRPPGSSCASTSGHRAVRPECRWRLPPRRTGRPSITR